MNAVEQTPHLEPETPAATKRRHEAREKRLKALGI